MATAIPIIELQLWLISESIGLNTKNLRLGRLPDKKSQQLCSSLKDTGSIENDSTTVDRADGAVGKITSHFYEWRCQVLTRSSRYEQGQDVQKKIYNTLHGRHSFALGSLLFCQSARAVEVPQLLEDLVSQRDLDNPFVWVTNYELLLRDSSTV